MENFKITQEQYNDLHLKCIVKHYRFIVHLILISIGIGLALILAKTNPTNVVSWVILTIFIPLFFKKSILKKLDELVVEGQSYSYICNKLNLTRSLSSIEI